MHLRRTGGSRGSLHLVSKKSLVLQQVCSRSVGTTVETDGSSAQAATVAMAPMRVVSPTVVSIEELTGEGALQVLVMGVVLVGGAKDSATSAAI